MPPVAPDFAFCHPAYGADISRTAAIYAGGILPRGSTPKRYTLNDPAEPSGPYDLPYYTSFSDVAISVEVASPVDIEDIVLLPDDIRGMAAWLADRCIGGRGTGGFITKGIEELVKYVTDPTSDLDAPEYPDETAFITVTLSTPPHAATFPSDYVPQMATFLTQMEIAALSTVEMQLHAEIAERAFKYAIQAQRMRRLGHTPWWDVPEEDAIDTNSTETMALRPANMTAHDTANHRRRKRTTLKLLPD